METTFSERLIFQYEGYIFNIWLNRWLTGTSSLFHLRLNDNGGEIVLHTCSYC